MWLNTHGEEIYWVRRCFFTFQIKTTLETLSPIKHTVSAAFWPRQPADIGSILKGMVPILQINSHAPYKLFFCARQWQRSWEGKIREISHLLCSLFSWSFFHVFPSPWVTLCTLWELLDSHQCAALVGWEVGGGKYRVWNPVSTEVSRKTSLDFSRIWISLPVFGLERASHTSLAQMSGKGSFPSARQELKPSTCWHTKQQWAFPAIPTHNYKIVQLS